MTSLVERLREYAPYMPRPMQADAVDEAAYVIEKLCEALQALIPNNICNNPNVPSDCNFPCDITMGELRQAWAALERVS